MAFVGGRALGRDRVVTVRDETAWLLVDERVPTRASDWLLRFREDFAGGP